MKKREKPKQQPMHTYLITKYLNFTVLAFTGKTFKIGIGNNSGEKLGYIAWIGNFRKYGFQPHSAACTISFDSTCLNEIVAELDQLNKEHKEVKNGTTK